ncbi:uncharacterized protein LOC129791693 [Lutzomyia longipalpis]|uniref:Uncharacterized protein n=1 Tax=Lutzomyia longipalpis TaxID=7200 RepID=A0A1B0ETM7_LUTLO|nr:uncharacterized protein LOC129791693 [Lutzomyia longipalpis]
MSVFRLNHCCCFFELTTGGIILGWINMVMSIINFILCCVVLSAAETIQDENLQMNIIGIRLFFGILLCVVTLLIVSDILLITGSIQRRALYLIPWLFNESIFLLFNFVAIFLTTDFSYIMASIAFFAFRFYLWLCVYSLYANLKEWPARDDTGFTYSRKSFEPSSGYADI